MKLTQAIPSGSSLSSLEQSLKLKFAGKTIGDIINEALKYIFPAAGLILLLYLIYGGYQLMLSGGDPKAVESGKQKITSAIIGFVIVFISYWLVQIIGEVLGIEVIGNIFK